MQKGIKLSPGRFGLSRFKQGLRQGKPSKTFISTFHSLYQKWTSSFLGGRTEAVVLEGECSPEVSVTSGVFLGLIPKSLILFSA